MDSMVLTAKPVKESVVIKATTPVWTKILNLCMRLRKRGIQIHAQNKHKLRRYYQRRIAVTHQRLAVNRWMTLSVRARPLIAVHCPCSTLDGPFRIEVIIPNWISNPGLRKQKRRNYLRRREWWLRMGCNKSIWIRSETMGGMLMNRGWFQIKIDVMLNGGGLKE